jgi:hypothetical protein
VFAYPFHMWTRLIPIDFSYFPQYFALITGATVAFCEKLNSQWGMQDLVSQVFWQWTTVREISSHKRIIGGLKEGVNQMQIKPKLKIL